MRALAPMLARLGTNDLQIFASLVNNERRTRRFGYSLLQKVYVRVAGNTDRLYQNDFVVAYVLDANKDRIRLISATGDTFLDLINEKPGSIYTVDQYRPILEDIVANERWNNPQNKNLPVLKPFAEIDLDVTTETLTAVKKRKSKKGDTSDPTDLVALVASMGRGIIRTNKTEKKKAKLKNEEIAINHF